MDENQLIVSIGVVAFLVIMIFALSMFRDRQHKLADRNGRKGYERLWFNGDEVHCIYNNRGDYYIKVNTDKINKIIVRRVKRLGKQGDNSVDDIRVILYRSLFLNYGEIFLEYPLELAEEQLYELRKRIPHAEYIDFETNGILK